jgi:hypothetical protein
MLTNKPYLGGSLHTSYGEVMVMVMVVMGKMGT